MPDRIELPGGEMILPYLETLKSKLQQACTEALNKVQTVTISYVSGCCNMAANRDYWDEANQRYVVSFNPDAPADDTVLVGRITDQTGQLVATVVNYACHTTTLAWQNTLISPDYVGAMREKVEQESGATCVFLLGACGDLGPKEGFVGDPTIADRNGRQLAYVALSALDSLDPPATDFCYGGPVISAGAALGPWVSESLTDERLRQASYFAGGTYIVEVPLKPMPDPAELQQEMEDWLNRQKAADERGDALEARNCGAMAERNRRWLSRLNDFRKGQPTLISSQFTVWVMLCGSLVVANRITLFRWNYVAAFPI